MINSKNFGNNKIFGRNEWKGHLWLLRSSSIVHFTSARTYAWFLDSFGVQWYILLYCSIIYIRWPVIWARHTQLTIYLIGTEKKARKRERENIENESMVDQYLMRFMVRQLFHVAIFFDNSSVTKYMKQCNDFIIICWFNKFPHKS